MRLSPCTGIAIVGSARARPEDLAGTAEGVRLSNADVYRRLLGEDWAARLEQRGWRADHPRTAWGVEQRQWLAADHDAGDLAEAAAHAALADARVAPAQIELCLVATSTPARISSALAARLGRALGIEGACVDVRAGGAGGLLAWTTAIAHLTAGVRCALVVAAEAISPYLDPADLGSSLLYGDGAGALVLARVDGHAGGLVLATAGNAAVEGRPFTVPGPLPPRPGSLEAGGYRLQRPDAAYSRALAELWSAEATGLRQALAERDATIDHYVPYAVTRDQVARAAAALGVEPARVASDLAETGCTGCAGPLTTLARLRGEGHLEAGALVALQAVAGGAAHVSLAWRI